MSIVAMKRRRQELFYSGQEVVGLEECNIKVFQVGLTDNIDSISYCVLACYFVIVFLLLLTF